MKDVDERIFQEHANSLFKSWERVAKALEVYRIFKLGTSANSMRDIDSNPGQLIKLASFYYKAVAIGGDDLRTLLLKDKISRGRTIIFERLMMPRISHYCDIFSRIAHILKFKLAIQKSLNFTYQL